jgi:hypothetical protein
MEQEEEKFFQSEARHVRLRTRVGKDASKYNRKSKHKSKSYD